LSNKKWRMHNPSGSKRVVVTKELPGVRWLEILSRADCKMEICTSTDILSVEEIEAAIGDRCDGAIGQLTEKWGEGTLLRPPRLPVARHTATTPWATTMSILMGPQNRAFL